MHSKDKSLYDILGVSSDADQALIKKAYRDRALANHPDHNPDENRRMSEINYAWSILRDQETRSLYDLSLLKDRLPHLSTTIKPQENDPLTSQKKAVWAQCHALTEEALTSAIHKLATRNRIAPGEYAQFARNILKSIDDGVSTNYDQAALLASQPLDVSIAMGLLGIQKYAEKFVLYANKNSPTVDHILEAALLDRAWDILAHGLERETEIELGGNPRMLKHLTGRRI
tara:strand:+ start:2753 stop:3439 length:687 start_codon:yes stop_codon:yes gene_type:complete